MKDKSPDTLNAAVLFYDDASVNGQLLPSETRRFESIEELLGFLSNGKQASSKRLVLLEIPSFRKPSISDISSALTTALGVPATVLHSHMHPGNNPFRFSSKFSNPILPTESGLHYSESGSVALPYYELRQFKADKWTL